MIISISPETAYDLGEVKEVAEQDIIDAIKAEYNKESDPYIVEVNDVELAVDCNSVYHTESGIVLDWFNVDEIHERLSEEFSIPTVFWRDRNGNIEEG